MRNKKIQQRDNPSSPLDHFKRGADGRLITKNPLYVKAWFRNEISNTTLAKKPIFLGKGVTLLDSSIRTSAYISEKAKLVNTKILSIQNKKGEASYIGRGSTIEDAQLYKFLKIQNFFNIVAQKSKL